MISGSAPIVSAARSARLPTISEWWYVPGVSTSRRRRSVCDGFASSSSWNTVSRPNTLPRTAKEPTVATAAPPAETAAAPMSWTTPVRSRSPSSENAVTTTACDDEDRGAGLDERLEAVAAADGQDAGQPAEHGVGAELERRPVHGARDDRDDRGHEDRRLRIEEHGHQQPDRRDRQDERQRRARPG